MFANPLLSLALVIIVEAISAVVDYLKTKLMNHINRNSEFGFNQYA